MQRQFRIQRQSALAFVAAALMLASAPGSTPAQEAATVIRGAVVFTGDDVLETATVTIRGRTIEAVTAGDGVPAAAWDDATVIDGQGMTLLPASSMPTRTASAPPSRTR